MPNQYATLGPFYRPENKRKVREERIEESNQDTASTDPPSHTAREPVKPALSEKFRPMLLSYAKRRREELKQERPMSKDEKAKNLTQEVQGKPQSKQQYKDNLRQLLRGQYAEAPTADQIHELEDSLASVPGFLGHVYSYGHGGIDFKFSRASNGWTRNIFFSLQRMSIKDTRATTLSTA